MNVTRRLNQLITFFVNRKNYQTKEWIYIYGLPRSGTSYLMQKLLSIARISIGDYRLGRLRNFTNEVVDESHVAFDSELFRKDIIRNLFLNASPGTGSKFDLIVKEIDSNADDLAFYTWLFQCPPKRVIFMYREPNAWLDSAMKKFELNERQAIDLYKRCFEAYSEIGGEQLEYQDISSSQVLKSLNINADDFEPHNSSNIAPSILQETYQKFKAGQ